MELCKKNGDPAVEETKKLNEKLKDKGVLVGIDGYLYNVLKIKPSLCISAEDIDFVVD
jgi:4-aminobutyrate aminotransferase-like enzyme